MQVARGGRVDARLPVVRDDRGAVQRGQVGDAAHLGQAAAARDVGLEHVDAPVLQPGTALRQRGGELGAADARLGPGSELGVAAEVAVGQGRLGQPQPRGFEPIERPQGVAPVAPAVAEVDQQLDLLTRRRARPQDQLHELGVRHRAREDRLVLDRPVAVLDGLPDQRLELLVQRARALVPGCGSIKRRVDGQPPAPRPAQQRVRGPPELLAGEVVQRYVDGREGMPGDAGVAVVARRRRQLVPERSDLHRIAPEQQPAHAATPAVGVVAQYERGDRLRRRVRLADADPPGFIRDADDDRVVRPVELLASQGHAKR